MKRHMTMLLLSLALIAVSLVLYSADLDVKGLRMSGHHRGRGFENAPPPAMMGFLGMFKLADELEITNPQLLQLRMLFQKNSNGSKMMGPRHFLHKKLSDPSLKDEDIKKIAAEEGKAVEESILAKFQMMQELKKILTPEQFKKLHECRSPMGRPGFTGPERGGKDGFIGKCKGLRNIDPGDKSSESSESVESVDSK